MASGLFHGCNTASQIWGITEGRCSRRPPEMGRGSQRYLPKTSSWNPGIIKERNPRIARVGKALAAHRIQAFHGPEQEGSQGITHPHPGIAVGIPGPIPHTQLRLWHRRERRRQSREFGPGPEVWSEKQKLNSEQFAVSLTMEPRWSDGSWEGLH